MNYGFNSSRGKTEKLAESCGFIPCESAAKLQQQIGEHPIILMNQVCSPAGTTIVGVLKLKELGFESAVNQGIDVIIAKDQSLVAK